jgi:effector-binding domain-containing protein
MAKNEKSMSAPSESQPSAAAFSTIPDHELIRVIGKGSGGEVTHAYDMEGRLLSLGITNGATLVTAYNY